MAFSIDEDVDVNYSQMTTLKPVSTLHGSQLPFFGNNDYEPIGKPESGIIEQFLTSSFGDAGSFVLGGKKMREVYNWFRFLERKVGRSERVYVGLKELRAFFKLNLIHYKYPLLGKV